MSLCFSNSLLLTNFLSLSSISAIFLHAAVYCGCGAFYDVGPSRKYATSMALIIELKLCCVYSYVYIYQLQLTYLLFKVHTHDLKEI